MAYRMDNKPHPRNMIDQTCNNTDLRNQLDTHPGIDRLLPILLSVGCHLKVPAYSEKQLTRLP